MKKVFFIACSILFIHTAHAQFFDKKVKGNEQYTHITRQVKNYDDISIAGNFYIELYQGTEGKIDIDIEENLIEYLKVENDNNKLKIYWEEDTNIKPTKKVQLRIPVEDIKEITLAGSVDVNNKEMLKFSDLEVKLAGSGNMNLNLTTNNLSIKLAGSGNIHLNGKSDNATFIIAGSGEMEAFDFQIGSLEAKVAGSGDMNVTVTEALKATVAGSGDISYKGHPKKDDINVAGSGSIKMMP